MPTSRMASLCKQKAVLVSVYVERPRRRRVSSNHHHHHHHHHHHLHQSFRQEVEQYKHGVAGKGYDRKAELLRYSHRLRESAPPATSNTVSRPIPMSSNNHHQPKASAPPATSNTVSHPIPMSSNNHHQPTTNTVAVRRRPKDARTPTCFGNWKTLIPTFLRSLTSFQAKKGRKKKKHSGSISKKMKDAMKSLEVQKKLGFISKLLSTLQKHR